MFSISLCHNSMVLWEATWDGDLGMRGDLKKNIVVFLVGNSCATGGLLQWSKCRIRAQGTKGRRKSWSKAVCPPRISRASSWLDEAMLQVLPRVSRRAVRDQASERVVFYQDTRWVWSLSFSRDEINENICSSVVFTLDSGLFERGGCAFGFPKWKLTLIFYKALQFRILSLEWSWQWILSKSSASCLMLTNLEIDVIIKAQSTLTAKYCFEVGDKITEKVAVIPCLWYVGRPSYWPKRSS